MTRWLEFCGQSRERWETLLNLSLLWTWRIFLGCDGFIDFHYFVSRSYNYASIIQHKFWYWRWSWDYLWCHSSFFYTKMPLTFCKLSNLGTSFTETGPVFKIFEKTRWIVWNGLPISETSWIIPLRTTRMASRTLAMPSGVVFVDKRPQHSWPLAVYRRPWSICTINRVSICSWHCLQRFPLAYDGFLKQFFEVWNKI